jgi:TonB-linked SusC/RagA family outer membrane protein
MKQNIRNHYKSFYWFKGIIKFLFTLLVILSSSHLYSQTDVLKGKITNDDGEAVSFASITVKGTKQKTTTNELGEFFLSNVSNNDILIISSIGYETIEYKIFNKVSLQKISLKRNEKELSEVEIVSSGYQDIPKERVTGSFVKIDNKTLNQQAGTNILKRLDGVTSGLLFNVGKQNNNPQNKTNISIRGLSTINGALDPLIVMDGFIYEGNIENINPNDIETITILKDAAASSIWGARAGNGVIVINSKRGMFNQKMQIGISSNIIVNTKPDPYYLPAISSPDYIDVEQYLFNNGYFDGQIFGEPYKALTPAVDIFTKRRNGLISSSDSSAEINRLKQIDSRKEYLDHFYTNSVTQQYALNIRGGNNSNSYLFSVAYDKNLGETYTTTKKLNIHFENSYKPIKNLILHTGIYYTNNQGQSGRNASFNSILINGRQVPYLRFSDETGNLLPISTSLNDEYTDTVGAGKLLNWKYVPLEDYKHSRTKNNLQELFANIGIRYKLGRYIDIELKYQYQRQDNRTEQLNDLESYATRSSINLFSQLDRSANVITYVLPYGSIRAINNSHTESNTFRGQLNFTKSFGNHDISAIAGAEGRQVKNNGDGYTSYGYNADPLTSANVDYVNSYPTFITGSYDVIQGAPSFSSTINRFVSLYANASYSFKRRYIVSGSMRKDGSNVFGVNANDKWKPLWSAGMIWDISNEKFYKLSALPILKIRLTYGHSGNIDLSKSATAVASYGTGSPGTNLPYARIYTLNNPDLKWEQIGIFNLGVDFSSINNNVSGSIELYRKRGIDLYGTALYDYTSWGYSNDLIKNVADMKGSGLDVVLNTTNLRGKISWTTSLLFNYNKSITTRYDTRQSQYLTSIIGGGTSISPIVGKPLYAVAAYKWGGLDNAGNPQGYLNGQLSTDYLAIFDEASSKSSPDNIVYIGTASPSIFGSLINTFSWKSLSLSVNISYRFKYFFTKPAFSSSSLISNGIGHSDYLNRWKNPGDESKTTIPAFQYPFDENRDIFYAGSEINVLKADNIKLNYINLSYSLNKDAFPKFPLKDAQIYLNIANLGMIWKANKEGLDPDYPYSIPPAKSFAFGIRANF